MFKNGVQPTVVIGSDIIDVNPLTKIAELEDLNETHFFFTLPKSRDISDLNFNARKEENLNSAISNAIKSLHKSVKEKKIVQIGIAFANSPAAYWRGNMTRSNVCIGEVVKDKGKYTFVSNLAEEEILMDAFCSNEYLSMDDLVCLETHFELDLTNVTLPKVKSPEVVFSVKEKESMNKKITRLKNRILKNHPYIRSISLDTKYNIKQHIEFLEEVELYLTYLKKEIKFKFIKEKFALSLKKFKGDTLEGRYWNGTRIIEVRIEDTIQIYHEFFHFFENISESNRLTRGKIKNYVNSNGSEARKLKTLVDYINTTKHNNSYVNYYKSSSEVGARLFTQYMVRKYLPNLNHMDTARYPFTNEEVDILSSKLIATFEYYYEIIKESQK